MNIGTIGSGSIVEKVAGYMQKTEHLNVTACFSRTAERGQRIAAKLGAGKVYTDLSAMLSDPEIQMIYIASPNSLHANYAKQALLAGKHVIVEKPMTPYLSQTQALYDLAEERHLLLFEASTIAHAPNFKALKAHLRDVGRIRLVQCDYAQYSSRYDQLLAGEVTNVFDPAFCGGAMNDINYYNIYTVTALFGRPDRVSYFPNLHPNGVDLSGIAVLIYPDFICQCTGAKDSAGPNGIRILGEKGYIDLAGSPNKSPAVRIHRSGGVPAGGYVAASGNTPAAEGTSRIPGEEGDLLIDEQPDGNQWYYEAQSLSAMLAEVTEETYETVRRLSTATLDTAWVLEEARKSAGMCF